MQVIECFTYLDGGWKDYIASKRPVGLVEKRLQVLAFNVLHHQVQTLPADAERFQDPGQIRMPQLIGLRGLLREDQARSFRSIGNFFNQARDVRILVPDQVECAEFTLSDQTGDTVAIVQDLPFRKRHFLSSISSSGRLPHCMVNMRGCQDDWSSITC